MAALPHNYALVLEYDGSLFHGFQLQEGLRTVQGEVERALSQVLRSGLLRLSCSGRTDAGVHATGQVAGFTLPEGAAPELLSRTADYVASGRLRNSLNSILGGGAVVRHILAVPDSFHPRFSCVAREYEYLIWNAPFDSPLLAGRACWLREPLDWRLLNGELSTLLGERDFAAFTRAAYAEENTMRYLDRLTIGPVGAEGSVVDVAGVAGSGQLLSFRIRGNAFLHNMVRIIVGTTIERGRGRLGLSLGEILERRDRRLAGYTAPSHALFFRRALYPASTQLDGLEQITDYPTFAKRALV